MRKSYILYGISFALLILGVSLLGIFTKNISESTFDYVSKGILDDKEEVKVIADDNTLIRPFTDSNVKIVKNFYDYKADEQEQKKSLIYYNDTYLQSTGIAYSNGSKFDVLAVLDGTVTDVKEDTTVGNSITIEHTDGVVSVYQSITDITVKVGDVVIKGDKIASSNTSNISPELENHLYFELIINNACVNPENYYDKSLSEV